MTPGKALQKGKAMRAATLSSKGQVTIPRAIRERLRLQPGDRVMFVVREDEVLLEPVSGSILDWYGALTGSAVPEWKTLREEVMATVAGETAREGQAGSEDRGG